MLLFSEKSNYPFGLDISDLSLKLVQLKKNGDKIKIQALNKISLPAGILENGEVKDREKMIKAIKEVMEKPKYGKITSREVVACLPETKTFIKLIEIMKTYDNIQGAIEAEIEKHVPLSIDEIYYDWQIIEDLADKQLILVGAAPRTVVNQYTDFLDGAKLSISALEIEPVSICRALLAEEHYKFKGERKKNYGIIDIGAKRSSFTIYSKNTILFSFSMPISGEAITRKIADTLKIDSEQAEKAKIICGLDEIRARGIIRDTLYSMIKNLVSKINESLMFFNYHFPAYSPLEEVILCGGGANVKDLNTIISEYINIKVSPGNVFVNLNEEQNQFSEIFSETHTLKEDLFNKNGNKNPKLTQDSSLSYATAIGLALRGIFVHKL